ncbi:uncharacterized protein LOC126457388 [Schistocerca serialis cubense]|uniref:uncharacterized protein LOC126457388 n=1 Tax=Schistocerca serialis cubense TaxID=2023355 RepID=UPI00214E9C68|nr:uncharacterized protein LOC126457388 [Schistocerca serialis cubense]
MVSSYGQVFIVASLAFMNTFIPALGNEIPHRLQHELPAEVYSVEYNLKLAHENERESSVERLQQELAEDTPSFAAAVDPAVSGDAVGGERAPQGRRKRFWSASESSEEEPADTSGYAAAFDALLDYHAEVQRQGRREVDMPDMRKETSEKLLFFTVTTRMSVSGVRLRVPATLRRVSRVTAEVLPGGDVDMSCNVRLGDFETWGQYDVKVNGIGPNGDFETTIRDRVVHATVRFRELPQAASASSTAAAPTDAAAEAVTAVAAPRCSLEATELTLVERGRNDVPAVLSHWASQVEDVPTTLRVMKQLLNERLSQYPCGDAFVATVRRGYAAPS